MKICYPITEKIVDKTCPENWKFYEEIGEEGNYGQIYGACCKKDCNYILKYLPYENDNTTVMILKEIELQTKCSSIGLCPKVEDAWLCKEGGAIVMERFETTVANLLVQYKTDKVRNLILANVVSLLDKLHKNGVYHGDAHLNNFMVKANKRDKTNYLDEYETYSSKDYSYYVIDCGKSGYFYEIDDDHLYKDYVEVLAHLEDLADEYMDEYMEEGFETLIETMKVYMTKFG